MKIQDLISHHKAVISVLTSKRKTETIDNAYGIALSAGGGVYNYVTHTDSSIGHYYCQISELEGFQKRLRELGCTGVDLDNAESFYLSSININANWGIPLYNWILEKGPHGEGVTFTLRGHRSRTVTMSVSFCWGQIRIHYIEWASLKDVSWSLNVRWDNSCHIDLANHLVRRAISYHSRMTDSKFPLSTPAQFYNRMKKEERYDPFLHKTTLRDPLEYVGG